MKQTRISREDWGALRMILCVSGYAVYSQSTENKINESSCVTVHRSNAVITVDKDLLEKAQCEMFGKNSISNGSLLFHQESAAKNGTPILVPFTFNRRGQSAFQAVVRCSECKILNTTNFNESIDSHSKRIKTMYKSMKYYVCDHARRGLLLHTAGCEQLPGVDSRAFIGSMYNHSQALTVATMQYANVHYCPSCITVNKTSETAKTNATMPALCRATKPKRKKPVKVVEPVRHFPL